MASLKPTSTRKQVRGNAGRSVVLVRVIERVNSFARRRLLEQDMDESDDRARRARQSLIENAAAIDKISAMNDLIATTGAEQSTVMEHIDGNVTRIADIAIACRDSAASNTAIGLILKQLN